MIHLDKIIQDLAACVLPEDLEGKTLAVSKLLDCQNQAKQSIGVLLSSARREHFGKDITGWVEWCRNNFNIEGSDRDHHRQVGDLLLDAKAVDDDMFRRLFFIEFQKLLAITRVKRDDLAKFLEAYPPEKMDRDAVRNAVNTVLGIEAKSSGGKGQAYQPDLWESIDSLIQNNEQAFQAMAMDEKFNENSARKFAIGGLSMMTACTTYWRAHGSGDAEIIAAVEKQLRDEADALAEIRNNNAASLLAG